MLQGEFEDYKDEILAEIHANEERALIEAELRAKRREEKKQALIDARKAGKGGVKVVKAGDSEAQAASGDGSFEASCCCIVVCLTSVFLECVRNVGLHACSG